MRTAPRAIGLLGLAAIALSLAWDRLFSRGNADFGAAQACLLLAGALAAPFALLPARWLVRYAAAAASVTAMYLAAAAIDLAASPPVARDGLRMKSGQGLVQPSRWGGFELTPGWRGISDDGVRPVEVAINALGDRDELPSAHDAAAPLRILLVGDSQTFGVGLAEDETIQAQVEAQARGRAVAYSLGVGGYGPGDSLLHYRDRREFPATHTFFLLYGNDLRADNCAPALHTAVAGVIVPTDPLPDAEFVERELRDRLREDDRIWWWRLTRSLALTEIRARLRSLAPPSRAEDSAQSAEYPPRCVHSAVEALTALRREATARGERFAVLIVPTPTEAARQAYAPPMRECMRQLAAQGIDVFEVLQRLGPDDYFRHHEHLNPSGASAVARVILERAEALSAGSQPAR